jgi:hypothetical protein
MHQLLRRFDETLAVRWPKARQWLWFVVLYAGGFLAVFILSYGLRLMIKGHA